MNHERLDALARAITSERRRLILQFIFNNPSCRFKDIDEYVVRLTGKRPSHCMMGFFQKAGIVQSERRGKSRHYTIALCETDPLYWVLFGDTLPEQTRDIVAPRLGTSLDDVCYRWDYYRREAMVANRFGGFSIDGLVEKTGLPKVWIQRFKDGFVDVTLRDFIRMCRVVGVKPSKVLREVGK